MSIALSRMAVMNTTHTIQPMSFAEPNNNPVRASVGHLLSKAYTLPCSTAAQAFAQLVQPTSRFQLALDALLPLLDPPASTQVRHIPLFGVAQD